MPVADPAQALRDEIDLNYPSSSEAQILAALNNKNLTGKRKILMEEIKAYLHGADKMLAIKESTLDSAKTAVGGMADLPHIDMTNSTYLATFTGLLDDLIADSLLVAADKTALLALGDILESWADQNYGRAITVHDIRGAKALP